MNLGAGFARNPIESQSWCRATKDERIGAKYGVWHGHLGGDAVFRRAAGRQLSESTFLGSSTNEVRKERSGGRESNERRIVERARAD